MLISYNNLILKGFFLKKIIIFYKNTNINFLIKNFFMINLNLLLNLFININIQSNLSIINKLKNNSIKFILKKINITLIKIKPIFYDFLNLYNLNLIKFLFIKNYKGLCFFINKPSNGQRT